MADLNPLIRLRKYRVEEKQKAMAELFRQAELLEGRKRTLLDDRAREEILSNESEEIDAYITFMAYAGRLQKEIDRLNQNLSKLDLRIAKGQEELREAFAEQKKIEIIQRKRDEDDAAKEAVKESNMMDDIGIESFRRKADE